MKRIFTLMALVAFVLGSVNAQFWSEDFETDGSGSRYTLSVAEYSDGSGDFFTRTDGANIGSYYSVTGTSGSFFFAGMDLDGDGEAATQTMTFDDIDITGKTGVEFSILIAETDAGDGNEDWDADAHLKIQYDIDNSGTFTDLIWISSAGATNTEPSLDTDFDGIGDGTALSPAFAEFKGVLAGAGSTVDIKISFVKLDAGDEDVAIDKLALSEAGGNAKPIITNVAITPSMDITSSTDVTVTADIVDPDGTILAAGINWGTESGVQANQVPMVKGTGDSYSAVIPAQADGVKIYYTVGAADNLSEYTLSGEKSYTVRDPKTATLPYSQNFDADMGDFYVYSKTGDTKYWKPGSFNDDGYMGMNGYGSSEVETDYLISPAFDMSATSGEVISYKSWRKYGADDADNHMKLFYSTDYAGMGDVAVATWTEIAEATFAVDAETWTETVDLDVSMDAASVHFAFVYTYASGSYVNWQVDSVTVKEDTATSFAKTESKSSIYCYNKTVVISSEISSVARMYNLAGQQVREMQIEPGRNDFQIAKSGIYLVKLNDKVQKVVIR